MTDHSQDWVRRRMPRYHHWWIQIKNNIYRRDGRICRKCGATVPLTIDHIIPLAEGGTNLTYNLQVLCKPCHNAKTAAEHRVRFAHFPAPIKPPPIDGRRWKTMFDENQDVHTSPEGHDVVGGDGQPVQTDESTTANPVETPDVSTTVPTPEPDHETTPEEDVPTPEQTL